jgi:hypothetical protein
MNGTPALVFCAWWVLVLERSPTQARGSVHSLQPRLTVGASQGPEVSIMLLQDQRALAASLASARLQGKDK